MKKISLWIILLSCVSACSDPRGLLQRSASGKLIDTRRHSQSKRLPIHNKRYIELAKNRTDEFITLAPDQLYEPEVVHQHIYNQMLEDAAQALPPRLTEVTRVPPSDDTLELQKDIAALKATITELKAELQLAKTSKVVQLNSYVEEEQIERSKSLISDDHEAIDDRAFSLLQAAGVYEGRICSMDEALKPYQHTGL